MAGVHRVHRRRGGVGITFPQSLIVSADEMIGAHPAEHRQVAGAIDVAREWRTVARKAAGPASYWLVLSLITFVGMTAVIKIEATRTRLVLVVVVLLVAFSTASLLEHLLTLGEPADEGWPRWYLQFNNPTLYRSSDDAPYSYVVLPRPMVPDWLSKQGTRPPIRSQAAHQG